MNKLIQGSSWLLLSSYITVLFSAIIAIVNGKILSAEDFGIISIAMIFVNVLDSLKQFGFKEYLIAREQDETFEENVQNAWTLEIIKGSMLSLACFISIPYMADLYDESRIQFVIAVFSISFIIDSLSSPALFELRKGLRYKELLKLNLYVNLVYFISSIFLVYYFKSYHGVVISFLVRTIAATFLSYYFCPKRPTFYFDFKITKQQLKYGIWILGSGLLFYFTNRFDNLILSLNVPLKDLGYYAFAFSVVNGVLGGPIKSINNALFPILSRNIREYDPLRLAIYMSVISLTLCVLFYNLLPWAVVTLIDEKWLPSIDTIGFLVISFCINAVKVDGFFMASGKTKNKFIIEFVRAVIIVSLCFPLVERFGIEGAAISMIIANLVSLLVWFGFIIKMRLYGCFE
ncbi:oligosaccharide flippase family protein [Photobacterium profundum]|uniref:oligosaccharide flippase family protein n=1 Tax=Photobacterium profundum TaxID=74109 RepID=UPI003D0AAB6B